MKADCGWSTDARRVLLVRCGPVAQGQTPTPVVAQMQAVQAVEALETGLALEHLDIGM